MCSAAGLCSGGLPAAFVCLSLAPPLAPHQLSYPVNGFLGSRSNGTLRTVSLGFLLPPALGSVPELSLQLLRSSEKAALKEFLRRGLDFFFCDF